MGDIRTRFVVHAIPQKYNAGRIWDNPRMPATGSGLSFNHAMVYSRDIEASLRFYGELLGLKLLERFEYHGRAVYARLKSPRGSTTIALHLLEPGQEFHPGAIRLYFEVADLKRFCKRLEKAGGKLSKQPQNMAWGWTHAY